MIKSCAYKQKRGSRAKGFGERRNNFLLKRGFTLYNKCMKFLLAAALLLGIVGGVRADAPVPMETRINKLLGQMTQAEKLSLLALDSGNDPLKLNTPAIPRLGIPSLRTIDAPQGLRDGPATAFPMEVVMASSWDTGLVKEIGAAIGEEARAKNRQIVYGPCLNLHRTPQNGRFFECFSEDPYLTARLGVAYIEGMQGVGVAACPKHFVGNDQETGRHTIDVEIAERPLHELYLTPFEAALREAHAWSLMNALNHINGVYMSENRPLLTDLLRAQWGWDGLVIGDWSSQHDTVADIRGGVDMEMPSPNVYSPAALTTALTTNKITQAQIDGRVLRILRVLARTGQLDHPTTPPASVMGSPAHRALALKAAREGVTLLQNVRAILPLNAKKLKTLAVIGPNAADTPLGGRWSADIPTFYTVSILDGLKKAAGAGVAVRYAQGCPRTTSGTPAALAEAVALAAKSDAAVVVVGTDNTYEGEEMDPPSLHLPGDQEALIAAIAKANPNTIVVLNAGTPLLMSAWLPNVRGVLNAWYAGQETGTAVGEIVFGQTNPSGKLADTLAVRREDYSDWGNYPGDGTTVRYAEGVLMGYRHFDAAHITPQFPFGFGLSYTTFAYSNLQVPKTVSGGQAATVRATIQNTGKRAGDEIAQLYLRPLTPMPGKPGRQLKGFARVSLLPGQKKAVSFSLPARAFQYWDTATHAWRTAPGRYVVEVGASSRDLRGSEVVTVR